MIGYDKEQISKLSKILPSEYEPVLPKGIVVPLIGIISYVSEGKSFDEISAKFVSNKRKLHELFENVPSLPRPYDFYEENDDLTEQEIIDNEHDQDDLLSDVTEELKDKK